MYITKMIAVLMPVIEMVSSGRLFPYALKPGENRLSLSPNMYKKKENKEDMETYLRDNAPYRKQNRPGMEKPKRTKDDLEQYLYEKYNFRKSFNPTNQAKEDQKYLYNNAPYRKSLQQFRSMPVLVLKLKNNNARLNSEESSDDDNRYFSNKLKSKKVRSLPVILLTLKNNNLARADESLFDDKRSLENIFKSKKSLRIGKNVEDANKKVLRLGAEGNLQCVAVKTRRKRHYDSTSSSSSKEFHSGEKRQFKLWREHYVCGGNVMPKYEPPLSDQALRPVKYKSTNRLLNDMLKEKKMGVSPLKSKLRAKPIYKNLIPPISRKTDVNQFLVPPRTEFELSELVI